MSAIQTNRRELLGVGLLLAISAFLLFFGLGSRVLWDVDEAMHADIARNIVVDGDWVTPTFNGENFYDKPILFSWLGALTFEVLGFTDFAARLPGALLGLACVLVTYLLGRAIDGPRVGFLGGLILATSAQFIIMSRAVVHDVALALCTTLALLLFYLGLQDERGRRRWWLLFWVAAGLAVLAKGPLGLVLLFLVIVPFLALTGRLALLRSMRFGWGLLVLLVVAGPWYAAISLRNPDFLPYFLWEKNLGSVVGRFHHRPKPITFYPGVLLGGMLPWSPYLPLALVRAWRGLKGPTRQPQLFLLLWAGTIFGFFFLMTSKRESYLLPMLPAVALLIAVPCRDLLESGSEALRKGFLRSAWVPFCLLLAVLAWVAVDPPLYAEAKVGLAVSHILTFLVPSAILLGVTVALFHRARDRAALASIVVLSAVGLVVFSLVVTPPVGPFKATRELGLELDRRLPPGERMVMYNRMRHSAVFYTGRRARTLHHPSKLVELLESEERRYCIISLRDLEKNKVSVEGLYTVLAQVGNKVLISNRPDRGGPTPSAGVLRPAGEYGQKLPTTWPGRA